MTTVSQLIEVRTEFTPSSRRHSFSLTHDILVRNKMRSYSSKCGVPFETKKFSTNLKYARWPLFPFWLTLIYRYVHIYVYSYMNPYRTYPPASTGACTCTFSFTLFCTTPPYHINPFTISEHSSESVDLPWTFRAIPFELLIILITRAILAPLSALLPNSFST